jgi:hypothetical protein
MLPVMHHYELDLTAQAEGKHTCHRREQSLMLVQLANEAAEAEAEAEAAGDKSRDIIIYGYHEDLRDEPNPVAGPWDEKFDADILRLLEEQDARLSELSRSYLVCTALTCSTEEERELNEMAAAMTAEYLEAGKLSAFPRRRERLTSTTTSLDALLPRSRRRRQQ